MCFARARFAGKKAVEKIKILGLYSRVSNVLQM